MDPVNDLTRRVELLEREIAEARAQQAATSEILKVISRSTLDLHAVLTTLIRSGIELCDASRGVVWLMREGRLFLAAHVGYSAEWVDYANSNPLTPAADAPTTSGLAAFTGEVVHVEDIPNDPRFRSLAGHSLGNYRAGLAVPLKRDGNVAGVIALSRPEARLYTDRQVSLVQTFADQAVIAIENARLFDEVQARTADLSEALQQQTATADVLKVISRSAFDLTSVLQALAHSAAQLCNADESIIFLRSGEEFNAHAVFGTSPEFLEFLKANPRRKGQKSLVPRVIESGTVEHIPDKLLDDDFAFPGATQFSDTRAMLGVPLLRDGRVEGVFSLSRYKPGPFSSRQIEILQTFADQALIAIENARLFQAVQQRTAELSQSLEELRTAQDRLVQTEKLASLGQLTAGIAHEIKNPLNFVNNFAALSIELVGELCETLAGAALDPDINSSVVELSELLKGNLAKVVQHGKRADSIVKNMLLHSRSRSGERRCSDINAIVEEAINLAYHSARAEQPDFNFSVERMLDPLAGEVDLFPQEIVRVLLNLFSNAIYAMSKRKAESRDIDVYEPTLSATTKDLGDRVEIRIRDNGTGIPREVKEKMFNPFFTTKPAGEGTGLGLSLSHDIIVRQHSGTMEVETEPGLFAEFRIVLPRGRDRS